MMHISNFGVSFIVTSVLLVVLGIENIALSKEVDHFIVGNTLWIKAEKFHGNYLYTDICNITSTINCHSPLQSCILYSESNLFQDDFNDLISLCSTYIRNSMRETLSPAGHSCCDNTTMTSDIGMLSNVFTLAGSIETFRNGTWMGNTCTQKNVSFVKLKDLKLCEISSNTTQVSFFLYVRPMKHFKQEEEVKIDSPAETNSFKIYLENLIRVYNCTQTCKSYPFFLIAEDMECQCTDKLYKPANELDLYVERLIDESAIQDEGDLLGQGEDFCIVAILQTATRPITFMLKAKNCSEKFPILCQNVTGTKIRYYFSNIEVNFTESSQYCSERNGASFLPANFQSKTLEKMQFFETLTKSDVFVWTGLFKQHRVSCEMSFFPEHCSGSLATNLTEKTGDCPGPSCVTEVVSTTERPPVNDDLKRSWRESWRTCCNQSKVLYEKGMEIDNKNFNLTREMVVQKVDEIFLNSKLVPGDFIVSMGTFSTTYKFHPLSENANLYDCALACKRCWYFGIRNNSCLNITSLANFKVAVDDDPMNIRLFSFKNGNMVVNTALSSSGVECVQIELNTDIFPVSYSLSTRDCQTSLPPLCKRANDSTYQTHTNTSSDFESAKEFCEHQGASLASVFKSKTLYYSRIPSGSYWTAITRKIHLLKTDCNAEPYDGYCRKMLITGDIVPINCKVKTNFICIKEKVVTTSSTTTTTTATTTTPKTTRTTPTTTTPTTTVRPTKVYDVKVIRWKNYTEAASLCAQENGKLWSHDLEDMEASNASNILEKEKLNKTWTHYILFASHWIIQRGFVTEISTKELNFTISPKGPYNCAFYCKDFPNFVSLKTMCYCLSKQSSIGNFSGNSTISLYSTIDDDVIEAFDIRDANKQCAVAILNKGIPVFPITYQISATSCEESHFVICQTLHGKNIRYVSLTNATYIDATHACLNLSMTLFDPINFNPSLLSKVVEFPETVKIWTPITREFLWRNKNLTEIDKKFTQPFCAVLRKDSTLESQHCGHKESALCFIDTEVIPHYLHRDEKHSMHFLFVGIAVVVVCVVIIGIIFITRRIRRRRSAYQNEERNRTNSVQSSLAESSWRPNGVRGGESIRQSETDVDKMLSEQGYTVTGREESWRNGQAADTTSAAAAAEGGGGDGEDDKSYNEQDEPQEDIINDTNRRDNSNMCPSFSGPITKLHQSTFTTNETGFFSHL